MWQIRQKDEDDEHYHRRVLAFARERKQGVKYRSGGGKDLGARKLPSDKDHLGPVTVSILGVPSDWDSQDLTSFLQSDQWKDLDVINRKPLNRQGVRWIVKGFPPEGSAGPWKYSDSNNDDTFIHISKLETSRPPATRQMWPAAPPRRHSRALRDFFLPGNSEVPTTSQVAPTQMDDGSGKEDQNHKTRARERSPRRDGATTKAGQAESSISEKPTMHTENVITEYESRGWIRKDMGGSGDCGWRSMAAAIAWNHD